MGGLVGKFREIGLRLQEIGMGIDDEIVWAVSAAAATQYAAFASYVVADWQQPQHPASMNQEAVASAVPAMKLQITQVFGPGGAMSLKATHNVALVNAQHHSLISQYRFVSNWRCDFLVCAGELQTHLDNVARSGLEADWLHGLRNGERIDSIRRYVANMSSLIQTFRRIALRLQEIGMRIDDEIVWAGLA
ncbi:MAG: hypothetical protein LQ350_005496 [Teloschistes chrysophthalmus]|nr:MAG: hypothetical protein LQ350_005496 [Niorma chrysophthalma]